MTASRTSAVWACRGDDDAVASHITTIIRQGTTRRLVFAGGRTPCSILDRMRTLDVPWHKTCIIPTDDRVVEASHAASNYGMLSRALNDTPAWISPISLNYRPRTFDLVWLGMGDDGKVASIFPGQELDDDDDPSVLLSIPDPLPPSAPYRRVTLNCAALANAGSAILVVRGWHKRRMVEASLASDDMPLARICRRLATPLHIFWNAG